MRFTTVLALAAAAGSFLTGCSSSYTVPADEVRRLGALRAAEESRVASQQTRRKLTGNPTGVASVGLRPEREAFGQGPELSNASNPSLGGDDRASEKRLDEVMRICRGC
jgi:hypothetical protein